MAYLSDCSRIALRLVAAVLWLAAVTAPARAQAQPPIPAREQWEARMIEQGEKSCKEAEIRAAIGSAGVVSEGNVWYYDGARVYNQIAVYTGDASWYECAEYSNRAYRDWVFSVTQGVSTPVGKLSGWRIFPDGLLREYLRTGNEESKEAIHRLAHFSPFAGSGGATSCDASRETAYIINAYLTAEAIGEPRNPTLAKSINFALGHIDQWFVSNTCGFSQPFMAGLTMEALIRYYQKTRDERIPPALRIAADGLWEKGWIPSSGKFVQNLRKPPDAATDTADLNLLIAPAFAWLWHETGDPKYKERGDRIFAAGVRGTNYWSGKQFSQNYRWSFDYIKWRSLPPSQAPIAAPRHGGAARP